MTITKNDQPKHRPTIMDWVKSIVFSLLYIAFIIWVEAWWGLILLPFIFDAYITRFINWGWWQTLKNKSARTVMTWVDALVFALIAVYFLNQFFFQNFVIPSSSLEKTLLTGDYLLVSKLAYGPRIPQTPLSLPLMQHTMPVLGCRSYLEHPHWDYRRVTGLGDVKRNDIVVFNYPSGDTVATNAQDQDYYRLAYQVGDQLLMNSDSILASQMVLSDMPYAKQQVAFQKIKSTGEAFIAQHPEMFGKVVSRPVDRRENYVKRCVGLPGDTLQIKNDVIYIDGHAQKQPENVQFNYIVKFKVLPTEDQMKEWGITREDMSIQMGPDTYMMPLTQHLKQVFSQDKSMVASITKYPAANDWLYPQNLEKGAWSAADYGPIWIPKKGATLQLTLQNLPFYERVIRNYEGNTLAVRNGQIYINGQLTHSYTFKYNYYWMMGDNRDNSADSRFWGFVPETHVVGKPLFVWLSLNKDYGWFNGKIRWNRFLKNVSHIQ